jgi:5-methylcytosine-specific restriction endonuclease McrA
MSAWHRDKRWRVVRKAVLDRDRHVCQIDGRDCTRTATHVDHILSPELGGAPFHENNLRASCPNCNLRRARPERRPGSPAHRRQQARKHKTKPSRNW